ncbi:serine hydrolase [Asticcacaulis sp. 201]|uniref:serine hydrolase n=1 Tax=Asticcacaulis sp. 201 TaxID=3028787 RepID=UPI002916B684|nr:serine hydrolase [Asticcacaulis sp. 201]MDV6331145.1 serine hydrolase [Asticcacaulis sp. 201]
MLTSTRRTALFGALAGTGFLAARPSSSKTPLVRSSGPQSDAMAQLMARWTRPGKPGAAITVSLEGACVFSEGFGAADLENIAPVTPKTVFHVASLSKQFTAYAALILTAEGKLSLDEKVLKYLPEVRGAARDLTLRHLLHHSGGLRDAYTLLEAGGWRSDDAVTDEQLRRMVYRQSGLNFKPGDRFQYNNSGYFLLAQIVARVSAQPFPDFCLERIFIPLGMTDTRFNDDNQRIVTGRANSYFSNGEGFERAILNSMALGPTGLLTTSEDLCRWAVAFEGKPGQTCAMKAMHEQLVLSDGTKHFYAMGQERHLYNGLDTWSHGGRDAGFRAFLLRVPDQRFSVAVLSNTSAFDASRIAFAVADIYLVDKPGFVRPVAEQGEPDAARLQRYAGAYELFPGLIMLLATDGKTLSTTWLGDSHTRPLKALSPTTFLFDPEANITLEFDPAEPGIPNGLKYRISRNGVLDVRRLDLTEFDAASLDLSSYVGLYRSADLATEYELLLDGGRLVARHQRLSDIALYPYQTDLMHSFKAVFGRLAFQRNMAGKITGFNMSGAVAEDLWFERV